MGGNAPGVEEIASSVSQRIEFLGRAYPRPVINATGVIIHTNLGRAPLSTEAMEAMKQAAEGYIEENRASWKSARHANQWENTLNRHSPDGRSIQPPWWKNSAAGDNPKARKRRISPPAHFGLPPIHGFATGKRHFAPLRGLSDAVLPTVGACGGTAWLNIATFALVEARRSFAECAGTDRTAPRPPPSGRSCSARG